MLLRHMQAERWGSELLTEDVEHVDLSKRPFTVRTSDTEVLALLAGWPWCSTCRTCQLMQCKLDAMLAKQHHMHVVLASR